jgi:hypothetical protein
VALASGLSNLGINGRGTAIFEPGFVGVASIGYGFGYGCAPRSKAPIARMSWKRSAAFPAPS